MSTLPNPDTPLDEADARAAFDAILRGDVADTDIADFLTRLADRGETVDEIVAAASVMRSHMAQIAAPANAIDVCGTGGDGAHTFNISTAVAIVVAACGVPVAKHGNRAASSKSGAADVLTELGLDLDLASDAVERSLAKIGIGFLFAAKLHPVMGRVATVRRAIGRRTIFNLLGPLANPAGVKRQLVGVAGAIWVDPLAEALGRLGADDAMVVHGDGLDEISISGPTVFARFTGGHVSDGELTPDVAGLDSYPLEDLRGGSPAENADALRRLLAGEKGAYRDIVCINAAAALLIGNKASGWVDGAKRAGDAIDSGAATDLLKRWVAFR